MLLTASTLQRAVGLSEAAAILWLPHIQEAAARASLTTVDRLAAFLAQVGHESGSFRYLREIWGPTKAQRRYEGRADLGNTEPGDGFRYRGRGLIQVTGRLNYARAGKDLGVDLLTQPGLLETPRYAALSAADYWKRKGLNALADAGRFLAITQAINGGLTGHDDRKARYAMAKEALS